MSDTSDVFVYSCLVGAASLAVKDLYHLTYVSIAFCLHFLYGLFSILNIVVKDEKANEVSNLIGKIAQTLGLPLIATEICLREEGSREWIAYANLIIPLADVLFNLTGHDLAPETLLTSKLISVVAIAWITYSTDSNNIYGYSLALIWLMAEIPNNFDNSEEYYPAFCTFADMLTDIYFTGRIFGQ